MNVGGPCNSWLRSVARSWAAHMKYRGSTGEVWLGQEEMRTLHVIDRVC